MKRTLTALSVAALLGIYWVGGVPLHALASDVAYHSQASFFAPADPSEVSAADCAAKDEQDQQGDHQDQCGQSDDGDDEGDD